MPRIVSFHRRNESGRLETAEISGVAQESCSVSRLTVAAGQGDVVGRLALLTPVAVVGYVSLDRLAVRCLRDALTIMLDQDHDQAVKAGT